MIKSFAVSPDEIFYPDRLVTLNQYRLYRLSDCLTFGRQFSCFDDSLEL